MSRFLNTLASDRNNDVDVNTFWGGNERGTCVQLNQHNDKKGAEGQFVAIQLTREQARQLRYELDFWLESSA
jgi:hypothetical protein